MRIRNFQANTVAEALKLVKEELGPDAVILKTTAVERPGKRNRTGAKRFEVTACMDSGDLPKITTGRVPSAQPPPAADSSVAALKDLVLDMRADVRYLASLGSLFGANGCSDEPTVCLRTMISGGLDPLMAERIIAEINETEIDKTDIEKVRAETLRLIESRLTEPSEIKLFVGRPTRVAFVGPPGCGKSALIAKLASHFVNEKKTRVALRSLDDFKPNAINEIERYGKLLNVPCFKGSVAIEEWDSSGVILIDTAGLPVGADDERDALGDVLSQMDVDEIHLVLPAYCRWDDLRVWYDFYKPLEITSTAVTHLDQTRSTGAVLSLAMLEQNSFSYFSRGRTSTVDLDTANLRELAGVLLDGPGGAK